MAVGVTLVALWSIFARHDSAPAPVSTVLAPPLASHAHDGPVPETTVARELALFQEIVRVRQAALLEARILVPPLVEGGRLPSAPSGFQKDAARRDRLAKLASAQVAKMLADIAHAHEMTRDEIEDIYRRGEAEGWPTGSPD